MKRTIKLIALVLCFAMLFGCSNASSRKESTTSTNSAQQSALEILTTAKTATKFTSEPISEDHIKQILSAGLNAPSARNSQPWHFSVVTDKEILNKINEAMAAGMFRGEPGGPGGSGRPGGSGGPGGGRGDGNNRPEGRRFGDRQPPNDRQPSNDKRPANAGMPPGRLGLTDAAVAVFVYGTNNLPSDSFDCGLATEAMSVAALSLGYGTKIVSSPSIALNG